MKTIYYNAALYNQKVITVEFNAIKNVTNDSFSGNVSIEVEGEGWKEWDGEFGYADFKEEFGFVIAKDDVLETYDIHFNDSENSNNKGFEMSYDEALNYIKTYNGTNESYFADYKGGMVSIVDNETGENVYQEEIR